MNPVGSTPGVLAGFRVVEIAAIGPVPFCGMLLADMGAESCRIDRPAADRRDGASAGRATRWGAAAARRARPEARRRRREPRST